MNTPGWDPRGSTEKARMALTNPLRLSAGTEAPEALDSRASMAPSRPPYKAPRVWVGTLPSICAPAWNPPLGRACGESRTERGAVQAVRQNAAAKSIAPVDVAAR